jgi:hypothetical protein
VEAVWNGEFLRSRRVGRLQINLVTRGIDILLLCALAALPVTTPAQQRVLVAVRVIPQPEPYP